MPNLHLHVNRSIKPINVRIVFMASNGVVPNVRTVVLAAQQNADFHKETMFVFEAVKAGSHVHPWVIVSEANMSQVDHRFHRLSVVVTPNH